MQLTPRTRPIVIALTCVAGAVVLRAALHTFLGGTQVWLTFWPAVFAAAWFGGLRAGLLAVTVSLMIVISWLVPSAIMTLAPSLIGASVFVVCGVAFSYVAEAARRSRREAIEASRAKDEFLAVLGHELRNPLAPIASASALLRVRAPGAHELDVIDRQVEHMSRLVDDLLDISRIVRGQLELQRSVVDLAAVVEKASEMVLPQRERGGHQIAIDVPVGIYVDADGARLVQVITNVLVNAIKFSPADQPIEIVARRDGERAVLTVRDHGVGMDAGMLARAFEPFVQGEQASDRAEGGLGLGLAIARRLVVLHGGTLVASSTLGEGTTIELALPTTLAPAVPAAPVAPSAGRLRILVVDDNADAAQMLGMLLESRGHDVQIAFDGPAALELLDRFQPMLALLDIGLPGMDGHELARRMRERGITARLIALTGYGQDSDRERALAAGFDDHLAKPVDLARIDAVIRELAAA